MSAQDDLATLRRRVTNYASVAQDYEGLAALSRVESRLARLEEGLRRIAEYRRCLRFDVTPCAERPEIDPEDWCPLCALLADQDGASQEDKT